MLEKAVLYVPGGREGWSYNPKSIQLGNSKMRKEFEEKITPLSFQRVT